MHEDALKRSLQNAAFLIILLVSGAGIRHAVAATEAEKLTAIETALAYLHKTQSLAGHWGSVGNEQAATGAVAFAFLSQKDKWGDNAAQYRTGLDRAITYLLTTANIVNVSTRSDGVNICPAGAPSCTGVYWFANAKSTYATGLIAPGLALYGALVGTDGIATTSGPLAGMTWRQIGEAITNVFAASQSTTANGDRMGGWSHLIPGNGESDSASTQSAVVSLFYNETLGAVTPQAVKDALKAWLANVQNSSGAMCNRPGTEPCGPAETGAGLLAMRLVGYDLATAQVQAALRYLNVAWRSSAAEPSHPHFGDPYVMWAVYKGLAATIGFDDTRIVNVHAGCAVPATAGNRASPNAARCTWAEDYSHWLVNNKRDDEGARGQPVWTDPIAIAFFINILGSTQLPVMGPSTDVLIRPKTAPQTESLTAPVIQSQIGPLEAPLSSAEATQITLDAGKLRPRLRRGVLALTTSDDGSALATIATDNRIRIWDSTTGVQRLEIAASARLLTGLVFASSGTVLGSVGRDSSLRLWDAANGNRVATLLGHEHAIRAVAASRDGSFLATGGEETRVLLWNLTTRRLSKVLFGATDFVNTLVFSPNSRLLASGNEDARVVIFDVSTGKSLFTLRGHSGAIDAVAFSPNGNLLASAGQDTVIRLWDPAAGQQRLSLRGHSEPIRTITFSPDARLIASGGEDTRIILWNSTTGALDKVLTASTGTVNALTFDPKGRFLASAHESGEIILWNVITGVKLRTIKVLGAQ